MTEPLRLPVREAIIEARPGRQGDRPTVELTQSGGHLAELELRDAEALALEILRACRASEMDAFLVDWMHEWQKFFKPADAEFLLGEFRAWRLQRLTAPKSDPAS